MGRSVVDGMNPLALEAPLPVRSGEVVLGRRPRLLERHMAQGSASGTHDLFGRGRSGVHIVGQACVKEEKRDMGRDKRPMLV